MSEFESSFDFTEIDDDGLDIAAIFGDSNADAAQPHELFGEESDTKSASTPETQDVQPEPVSVQQPQEEFASPDQSGESADRGDDLFAALTPKGEISQKAVKSVQDTPDKQVSLFDKPPIFSYGGVKEEIKDPAITFEELRISKASDFPELLDGKKVTWSVSYGKTTKTIPDPAGTTIASMKEEIEKSKTFLDMLKKAKEKDRSPDCLVTPKLTAQSKGIASYKGIFTSVEEARASDKAICLIPSSDGQIYEMRRTEMGDFIAPKHNIVDFSAVRAGFFPALPLIPRKILAQIIAFFRCLMDARPWRTSTGTRNRKSLPCPFLGSGCQRPPLTPTFVAACCRRIAISTMPISIATIAWQQGFPISTTRMKRPPGSILWLAIWIGSARQSLRGFPAAASIRISTRRWCWRDLVRNSRASGWIRWNVMSMAQK